VPGRGGQTFTRIAVELDAFDTFAARSAEAGPRYVLSARRPTAITAPRVMKYLSTGTPGASRSDPISACRRAYDICFSFRGFAGVLADHPSPIVPAASYGRSDGRHTNAVLAGQLPTVC
jgi:hypothetical protein